MQTLRRSLYGLAASYPLAVAGFIAGISVLERPGWGYLVLLLFYAVLLGSLKRCVLQVPAGKIALALALLVSSLHACLTVLFCIQSKASSEYLVLPLLLGPIPVMMLVGLGASQLAHWGERPALRFCFGLTTLAWLPLWAVVSIAGFAGCFMFQCILLLILASVLQEPVGRESEDIGFSRFS